MLTEILRNDTGGKICAPDLPEVQKVAPLDKQQQDFERLLKKQRPARRDQDTSAGLPLPLLQHALRLSILAASLQAEAAVQPADADVVMRALTSVLNDAGFAPPVSCSLDAWANDGLLCFKVASGPLAGAEIQVAMVYGRCRLTMRSTNNKQRTALESIRHKLASAVFSALSGHPHELQIGGGND